MCAGGLALAAAVAPSDRPDLLPRNVYWQLFPSDVRTVKNDRNGRPWFELDGTESIEQIKQQIEADVSLKAPWVRSARILLFDSAGRISIAPNPCLLLAYDPHTRGWIEHPTPSKSPQKAFCGPAVEDTAGRIFIADRSGCQVFDHGVWSDQ